MKIAADLHIHSIHSIDGSYSIDEFCRKAVEIGLKTICFTEHVDFHPLDEGTGYYDSKTYFSKLKEARQKFGAGLEILGGLEFSEPHLYETELEHILEKNEYDMIIGSIHWLEDFFVGQPEALERYSIDQLYSSYYDHMQQAVTKANFDVLGHINFPKRYLKKEVSDKNILENIVKTMVDNNLVLEINTSSLRKGLDECLPDLAILQTYVEAGGSRVTIGSDAHFPEDLAADFDYVERLLSKIPELQPGIFRKRTFF